MGFLAVFWVMRLRAATDAASVVDRDVFSSSSCAVKVSNDGGSEVARDEFLTAVAQEANSGPNPMIKIYTRALLDMTKPMLAKR